MRFSAANNCAVSPKPCTSIFEPRFPAATSSATCTARRMGATMLRLVARPTNRSTPIDTRLATTIALLAAPAAAWLVASVSRDFSPIRSLSVAISCSRLLNATMKSPIFGSAASRFTSAVSTTSVALAKYAVSAGRTLSMAVRVEASSGIAPSDLIDALKSLACVSRSARIDFASSGFLVLPAISAARTSARNASCAWSACIWLLRAAPPSVICCAESASRLVATKPVLPTASTKARPIKLIAMSLPWMVSLMFIGLCYERVVSLTRFKSGPKRQRPRRNRAIRA